MSTGELVRLLSCLGATAALISHHRRIAEAIEAFRNNFRGGPPPPRHPLLGFDEEILRLRRRHKNRVVF